MRCSNIYNDPEGNHITSGLEYETVSLFCPNCLIWDFDVAARLDRLCDEMGIDTIEAGNLIAICMDGGVIDWGDGEGAIKLLEGMSEGTELGRIMGEDVDALEGDEKYMAPVYALRKLKKACGVENITLLDWGLDPSKFAEIAHKSRDSHMRLFNKDPFMLDEGQVVEIIKEACGL